MDIKNKINLTFSLSHFLTRSPAHLLTCSPAHQPTSSPAHPLIRSPAHLHTCSGFTLLELLVVLIIIGFLVTAIGRTFRKVDKDIQITAALSDMKAIADAIVKGIYLDIGYIPYPKEDPLLTTAYLCLSIDCSQEQINNATYYGTSKGGLIIEYIDCDKLKKEVEEEKAEEVYEICRLLGNGDDPIRLAIWNKWNILQKKGWRGPYVEPNATYYKKGYGLPIIETPWADRCEKMAKESEEKGNDDLAKEYRNGKYYQILPAIGMCAQWKCRSSTCSCKTEEFTDINWAVLKSSTCILSKGKNCLSDGLEEYLQGCIENCQKDYNCKKICEEWCYENKAQWKHITEQPREMERCMPGCFLNCRDDHVSPCFFSCIEELKHSDPSVDGYIDIGDDIVMFVSSGVVRSPLEK